LINYLHQGRYAIRPVCLLFIPSYSICVQNYCKSNHLISLKREFQITYNFPHHCGTETFRRSILLAFLIQSPANPDPNPH